MSSPSTLTTPVRAKDSFLGELPSWLRPFEPIEVSPDSYGPLISPVKFLESPPREPMFGDPISSPRPDPSGHNFFPPKFRCPYPIDDPRCQGRENGYEPLEVSQRATQELIRLFHRPARGSSAPTPPTALDPSSSPPLLSDAVPPHALLPAWEGPSGAELIAGTPPLGDVMSIEEVPEADDGYISAENQNYTNHPCAIAEDGGSSDDDGGVLFPEDKDRLCRYLADGLSLMCLLPSQVVEGKIRCDHSRMLVGDHWEDMLKPCIGIELAPDDYQRHVKTKHAGIPRGTSIRKWVHAHRPTLHLKRENAGLFVSGAQSQSTLPKRVRKDR